MKKYYLFLIILILTLLLITGCGGGDGGGSSSSFHPPGWIQGNWAESAFPSTTLFEFTSNNVIQYGGGTLISFKDIYKSVTENITSSLYEFTLNYGTTTFSYSKNPDGSLTFTINGTQPLILVKKN